METPFSVTVALTFAATTMVLVVLVTPPRMPTV